MDERDHDEGRGDGCHIMQWLCTDFHDFGLLAMDPMVYVMAGGITSLGGSGVYWGVVWAD